jgi:hypothetical protein
LIFGPTINLLPTSFVLDMVNDVPVLGVPGLPPVEEVIGFAMLDPAFWPRVLVLLKGGFGVWVSRLPKSVSDRSMGSPENIAKSDY